MPTSRKPGSRSSYVTVVSANAETLDGLQSYLQRAGLPSHCTRAIHDVTVVAPELATATVIFPDDFDEAAVHALVTELRRRRPRLLILLVTRAPHRFRSAVNADGRSLTPLILPRPSFGWDILDAIRGNQSNPQI